MSQYVFTMTSRMVAITATCLVLLFVLLFVMGIEIGKLLAPAVPPVPVAAAPAQAQPTTPVSAVAPAPAAASAPPTASASPTYTP